VVFQNGAGSPLEVWEGVIAGLGDTPAISCDRPGIAGSAYDGSPSTPERVSAHLHALLGALDIAPPYVLVGHSWGGPLILDYVGRFPSEVAGMVYVDPLESDLRRILRSENLSTEAQ
jgi:pimeloyl-ACP methyl ester carboxylesterase